MNDISEKQRRQHNASKGRIGYLSKVVPTSELAGVGYDIQIDHRGKFYAYWKRSLRRLDILKTRAGIAIAGPDGRQFRAFLRDGKWILRDIETETDFDI